MLNTALGYILYTAAVSLLSWKKKTIIYFSELYLYSPMLSIQVQLIVFIYKIVYT